MSIFVIVKKMTDSKILDAESLIRYASDLFRKHFNVQPEICGCAPGRVNLIGEHTDYNDGFVLPLALPMVTVLVGKRNLVPLCRIITSCPSVDDPKEIEFEIQPYELNAGLEPGKPSWANYVKGVIANYKGKLCGFDALIATSVPVGGSLSSSAALEVATYTFLDGLSEDPCKLGLSSKALACQNAEHEFAGTPCGIMDQFISFMGEKDHALLLDCRSLKCKLISLKSPEIAILITNTNVHHNLAVSEYSNRKKQCETAAEILGKRSLRDVGLLELENKKEKMDDLIYRRAFHVVTEIQRTVDAARALEDENYEIFGILMQDSHKSLRDNYEVSCPELNEVVNAALEVDGVFGSRMTGGGFGGCTVTLLKSSCIDSVINNIKIKYKKCPTFYVCRPGDGANMTKLSNS